MSPVETSIGLGWRSMERRSAQKRRRVATSPIRWQQVATDSPARTPALPAQRLPRTADAGAAGHGAGGARRFTARSDARAGVLRPDLSLFGIARVAQPGLRVGAANREGLRVSRAAINSCTVAMTRRPCTHSRWQLAAAPRPGRVAGSEGRRCPERRGAGPGRGAVRRRGDCACARATSA